MDTQEFELAVAAVARRQALRLRELGFAAAAAEVEALLTSSVAADDHWDDAAWDGAAYDGAAHHRAAEDSAA